jgi:hypothetical protein
MIVRPLKTGRLLNGIVIAKQSGKKEYKSLFKKNL